MTYGAVKLGALSTATLDNVVDTYIGTCQGLFPGTTRARDRVVTITIAVAFAMSLGEAAMGATTSALCRRPRALASGRAPSPAAWVWRMALTGSARCRSVTQSRVGDGREHLEGLVKMGTRPTRRGCWLVRSRRVIVCVGVLWRDADIDDHAVLKVLEPCNEEVTMAVLEDDASALIETIEVLDGGDDGVGSVVRIYVDSHGQPGLVSRRLGQQQLKANVLGLDLLGGRHGVMRRPRLSAGIHIHHARVLSLRQHIVVSRGPSLVLLAACNEVLDTLREALDAGDPRVCELVGDVHLWPHGRL